MSPIDAPPSATASPESLVMLRGEGRVTVTRHGRSHVACRLSGAIETVHVEWLLTELDRQLGAGAVEVFVDASRCATLSRPAQQALGAWSPPHPARPRALHVLGDAAALAEPLVLLERALGDRLHRYDHAEPFAAAMARARAS